MFISKRGSPYKSKSFLALSDQESKPSKIYFTLLIRSIRCWEKWRQCRRQCIVSSVYKLEEHKGFKQSWKLCRNQCSLRWLKYNRKRVRNFNPIGSNILYKSLWIGQMKDRILILNIAIDSEFIIAASNWN